MMPSALVMITRERLDAAALERSIANAATGAVVSFIGLTRDNHLGRRVLGLEYEAHEVLAQKMLEKLRAEAIQKFGLLEAGIHHRFGRVEIGEASVVIVVASAHRAAAFEGCRYLIDELKTSVPIWKKEFYADGAAPIWVGP